MSSVYDQAAQAFQSGERLYIDEASPSSKTTTSRSTRMRRTPSRETLEGASIADLPRGHAFLGRLD